MSGISELGITLTSLFSFLLLALISQIIYLLWRHRQQTRRKNNRIEPTTPALALNPTFTLRPHTIQQLSPDQSEALKLDELYGHARVLFTIKEEEREGSESDDFSSFRDGIMFDTTMRSLSEHFNDGYDIHHVISIVGDGHQSSDFDVEPPYLTPSASPPYYTPSPSPTR